MTTISYLQAKLPLDNQLLRQLGCLNPVKRTKSSTVSLIESIACTLQPKVDQTQVVDEWKVYQVDTDLPNYDPKERIEVFWKQVFELQGLAGEPKYQILPVVKSALVSTQKNAESECSLSVNARIVTKDRSLLGEKTIVGIHTLKEAVWFFDPDKQPEKIEINSNLKKAVKSAHAAYRDHLEREKEIERKKKEEERRLKDLAEKEKEEKEMLLKKKESLAKSEEGLDEQEKIATEELKQVGMKTHKLLDEVLPSTSPSESKSKGSGKRKDKGGDEKGKGRKKLKGK